MSEDKPWYEAFFTEDYLTLYHDRISEKQTKREIAMVEQALQLASGAEVLDLACGNGRHSVRLARHGYRVTALDLNPAYITLARQAASTAGVAIDTVAADMRHIPFEAKFDAVLSLFTSFGYLESEEEDLRVLQSVHRALKPGGAFLVDVGNREYQLESGEGAWSQEEDGTVFLVRRSFDPLTGVNSTRFFSMRPGRELEEIGRHDIRLYTMTELLRLLRAAGLEYRASYGDYRCRPYSIGSRRMIVVATKPA